MNEQTNNPSMKESMTQAAGNVKETARETKDTIKAKAKEAVSQAKNFGQEYAQQGKEKTANRIGEVSESMRQTAERFEREQDPNIARYTRLLADKLEGVASYVREHDLNSLRRDGEDLARRHPAIFFGGMFVAGLAAARFLKASADREGQFESSQGFSGGMESHETISMREQEQCQPCQTGTTM